MNDIKLTVAALGVGILFGGLFIGALSNDFRNQYFANKKMVESCEKELPRTKVCVLIALPKGDK